MLLSQAALTGILMTMLSGILRTSLSSICLKHVFLELIPIIPGVLSDKLNFWQCGGVNQYQPDYHGSHEVDTGILRVGILRVVNSVYKDG